MLRDPGAGTLRQRPLRADARRNRERLLAAARDVFVELGADAPLDDVARRAGVGIATLYRRFPDRPALLREVALDVLGRSAAEATAALAEEPDAFAALGRYMHRAVDLRIAAVMPEVVGRLRMDDEQLQYARRASVEAIDRIIATAHADGALRPDVASGDVGLLLVRLTRPLPGPFPGEVEGRLTHRHLDLLLDGLRSTAYRGVPLPDPAMTFDDLADMPPPPVPR
ncbi:MAG TPA: TetR/AcrR family transcriptional regulator [Actinomycetota bacterium]